MAISSLYLTFDVNLLFFYVYLYITFLHPTILLPSSFSNCLSLCSSSLIFHLICTLSESLSLFLSLSYPLSLTLFHSLSLSFSFSFSLIFSFSLYLSILLSLYLSQAHSLSFPLSLTPLLSFSLSLSLLGVLSSVLSRALDGFRTFRMFRKGLYSKVRKE